MRKLTVLLITICFMTAAASCSSKTSSSGAYAPLTSAEVTSSVPDASRDYFPASSADDFTTGFIAPVIKVHLGEMGCDLKIKEATIDVFKFISDHHIFKCSYDEVSQNLRQALNAMDPDDINTFRENIATISNIIDDVKLGKEDAINSFDDIESAQTVKDYIADPATYESWMALLTVLNQAWM